MYNELLNVLKKNYVKKDYKLELFDYKIELNSFMSDVIMNDITTNYNKVYKIDLPRIRIIIKCIVLDEKIKEDIQLMLNRFYTILNIFDINKIKYNKRKFHFVYIPTNYTKQFPTRNNTLGPYHINSGVSWIYHNKLMVWRAEECLKVFIHELFHCLGFDRFLIEKKCNLTNHYNITTHVNCNEGYNELCALIYHNCFLMIEGFKGTRGTRGTKERHNSGIDNLIEDNKVYTYYQIKQILQHYNLNTIEEFKQDTGVFSYFILKGYYLYYLDGLFNVIKDDTFLLFPIKNMKKFHKFEKTILDDDDFKQFIEYLIKNNEYRPNNTLKMILY
jgi:hypothetical protein